jgi:hypothetical protein
MFGAGHGAVKVDAPKCYVTWLRDAVRSDNPGWSAGWEKGHDDIEFGDVAHTVALPLLDRQHRFGLSGNAISDWWTRRREQDPHYHLLSRRHNCDGTVVEALLAGGAEGYAPPPNNLVYQGSATLLKWARALSDGITKATNAFSAGARLPPKPDARLKGELWNLADWKTLSAAGALAVRRQQILEIDRLLAQYHQAHHNGRQRFRILCGILIQAASHLVNKPHSPRRDAVLQLYWRVHGLVEAASADPRQRGPLRCPSTIVSS